MVVEADARPPMRKFESENAANRAAEQMVIDDRRHAWAVRRSDVGDGEIGLRIRRPLPIPDGVGPAIERTENSG